MFAVKTIYSRCMYRRAIMNYIKPLPVFPRHFHCNPTLCVKMFNEIENKYAFRVMEDKGYTIPRLKLDSGQVLLTEVDFNQILTNVTNREVKQIIEDFSVMGDYCAKHGFCISNKVFDDFIDYLTDNLKLASNEELEFMFHALAKYPSTQSIRTRNFIEVWAALDDECLRRIQTLSFDEMLHFVSLMFMINVTKASDFSRKCLLKLASKAKQLTTAQLIQAFFFVGVMRKQPFDMHNLELQLDHCFEQLTIDDLAIASMGFFKSKTPVRNVELIGKMINKIIENSKNINEISLAALLKVIRYSIRLNYSGDVYKLFDVLQYEVSRLSVMCNIHIALLGMVTHITHKDCLTKIADKVIMSMSSTRMKDLERLVLTYGTLNFTPITSECFFQKVISELKKTERESEITKYGRCFASCVAYLGLVKLYPADLISKTLTPEFLNNTYGKHCYSYGREILTLHNISEIFCSESRTSCLQKKEAELLAKQYTDFVPDEEHSKQYNVLENMFLDVIRLLEKDRGGNDFVAGDHIVTHHQKGDIIMCNNSDGFALPVKDTFNRKNFGLVRRPPDNNLWIVLVLVGKNALLHNSDIPIGPFQSKVHELKALGFHASLVPWSIFTKLRSDDQKLSYLKKLIEEAIKSK